jgi:DASS family divalent anion:Na+ symporter
MRLGIPVGIGVAIWLLPAPGGVTGEAWHLFAIFVATIVAIVLEPLPMGAVAICGITAVTLTGTLGLEEALTGPHPG